MFANSTGNKTHRKSWTTNLDGKHNRMSQSIWFTCSWWIFVCMICTNICLFDSSILATCDWSHLTVYYRFVVWFGNCNRVGSECCDFRRKFNQLCFNFFCLSVRVCLGSETINLYKLNLILTFHIHSLHSMVCVTSVLFVSIKHGCQLSDRLFERDREREREKSL